MDTNKNRGNFNFCEFHLNKITNQLKKATVNGYQARIHRAHRNWLHAVVVNPLTFFVIRSYVSTNIFFLVKVTDQ